MRFGHKNFHTIYTLCFEPIILNMDTLFNKILSCPDQRNIFYLHFKAEIGAGKDPVSQQPKLEDRAGMFLKDVLPWCHFMQNKIKPNLVGVSQFSLPFCNWNACEMTLPNLICLILSQKEKVPNVLAPMQLWRS